MNFQRRSFITKLSILSALLPFANILTGAKLLFASEENIGNFKYIYSNQKLKDEFLLFLTNVFHLFPEQKFHDLIAQISNSKNTDQDIYKELQGKLKSIKPFLAELRLALPALAAQKKIMTKQTLELLGSKTKFDGYMELGTTGRYIGALEDHIEVKGNLYLLHDKPAGYGPEDIVERGQLSKIGKYLDMSNYSSKFSKNISKNSLELVTVYIGFHHCPLELREEFITSIRDVMKVGGKLILRDHDAHNEDMLRMAALAHDVFNLGTNETLKTNSDEIRNFYSLSFIINYLENIGFKFDGKKLFQPGDPTKNALMAFTKI